MNDKFKRILARAAKPGKLRYFLIVAISYLSTAILITLSMAWEHARIDANFEAVARERGNALFRQFELVREWNKQQHEVYVPARGAPHANTPDNAPAPHDLSSIDGKRLTLTTPDEMIRQIAGLSEYVEGIKYHLTVPHSDDPTSQPDGWEAESLRLFELRGLKERLTFVDNGGTPVHRYMAPLPAGSGGISISMPAGRLLAIRSEQLGSMRLLHLAAFIVVAGLAHLAARRTYRSFEKLARLSANQKYLIEERTADLSMANALLAAEVDERRLNQQRLEESESRYRSVVESTQDGIALIQDSQVTFANGRLAEILGTPLKDIVGTKWPDLFPAENREAAALYQTRKLKGETLPICFRTHILQGDLPARRVTVDLQVLPIKDGSGSTAQWVLNIRNVSDRLRAERDRKLVAAVFDSTAEAIMVTDRDNLIAMINPAFTRITGYQPEEVIGQHPSVLSSGRHDKNFYIDMWRGIQETGYWAGEIWNRRKDGSLYVEWLAITALHSKEDASDLSDLGGSYVATFTDITHRKEAEDLLRFKASHDALTGLPNRSLFDDRLQLAISQAKRYRRSFALLYIDLDHFKEVNDTLGHAAGDELLIDTAHRMSLCIRESDTLSRFGGDEFAALLSEVDSLEEIEEIASRIVATLAEPFQLAQGTATISGSVGIAIYPEHGASMEQMKKNADLALYKVKESTRNAYRIFTAELTEQKAK